MEPVQQRDTAHGGDRRHVSERPPRRGDGLVEVARSSVSQTEPRTVAERRPPRRPGRAAVSAYVEERGGLPEKPLSPCGQLVGEDDQTPAGDGVEFSTVDIGRPARRRPVEVCGDEFAGGIAHPREAGEVTRGRVSEATASVDERADRCRRVGRGFLGGGGELEGVEGMAPLGRLVGHQGQDAGGE